jgi:hypothetical protein
MSGYRSDETNNHEADEGSQGARMLPTSVKHGRTGSGPHRPRTLEAYRLEIIGSTLGTGAFSLLPCLMPRQLRGARRGRVLCPSR